MEVMMMPGPLVTMVGEGDSLLLIYHSGHPLPGHQSLCYTFYTINSHQVQNNLYFFKLILLHSKSKL